MEIGAQGVYSSWLIARRSLWKGRGDLSVTDDAIDWIATMRAAGEDFAVPALATMLRQAHFFEQTPPDVQRFLSYAIQRNAEVNHRIREQCTEIGAALSRTGLSCVLLKGAVWLFEDGPAAEDRMLRDIDLLVPRATRQAAQAALATMGYAPAANIINEAGHIHDIPLEHKERPVRVELHVELTTSVQYLTAEEVLTQAACVAPGLYVPSLLHRIVHNVVHAQLMNGDYAGGALSFRDSLDLGRLIGKGLSAAEWSTLTWHARERDYFRPLSGALHKAAHVTGIVLPEPFCRDKKGRRHLQRCLLQRRWPTFDRAIQKFGVFRRATAWQRDAFALGLGKDRGLRAHLLVNRRRLQRIQAALDRHFRSIR